MSVTSHDWKPVSFVQFKELDEKNFAIAMCKCARCGNGTSLMIDHEGSFYLNDSSMTPLPRDGNTIWNGRPSVECAQIAGVVTPDEVIIAFPFAPNKEVPDVAEQPKEEPAKEDFGSMNACEAIVGFCGWLTSKKGKVVMGASHDCCDIPDLIKRFNEANKLGTPRHDWSKRLTHPPLIEGELIEAVMDTNTNTNNNNNNNNNNNTNRKLDDSKVEFMDDSLLNKLEGLRLVGFQMAWKQVQEFIHSTAKEKGWWDSPRNKGECIALMHSELSEALEALRTDKRDDKIPDFSGEAAELADCIIRIMDYAVGFDVDVIDALVAKLQFNKTRTRMHGGKKF